MRGRSVLRFVSQALARAAGYCRSLARPHSTHNPMYHSKNAPMVSLISDAITSG